MTNLYDYSDEELLELCFEYAREHSSFNDDFIVSLSEALDEYDELTPGQREALEKVVTSFRMVKWNLERTKK